MIAERAGTIDERVVVVAHRDAAGTRAEAELSGTAALLELARIFGAPRQTRRTITLVSTSGGSGGAAGAAHLADELSGPVGAVLVLGDLASRTVRAPLVTGWSNALGATPQRLRATVQEAVRIETGSGAGAPRALAQFARFAMPVTFGEQGPLLAGGLPAVLLSMGGDRTPPAGAPVSRERLQSFGRAALRTVTVLDAAPAGRPIVTEASSRDLLTSRKILPIWAVRLFTGALLLTVLVTAVDAFAALLRRREGAASASTCAGRSSTRCRSCSRRCSRSRSRRSGCSARCPARRCRRTRCPCAPPALLALVLVFALGWAWLRPALLRVLRADARGARRTGPRRHHRARRDSGRVCHVDRQPLRRRAAHPGPAHLAVRARAGPAHAAHRARARRGARSAADRGRRDRTGGVAGARRRRRRVGAAAADRRRARLAGQPAAVEPRRGLRHQRRARRRRR